MCFFWLTNWRHDCCWQPTQNHQSDQREHDVWTNQRYHRNQHPHWCLSLFGLNASDSMTNEPEEKKHQKRIGIFCEIIQICNLSFYIIVEFIDGSSDWALWYTGTAHIEKRILCDDAFSTTSGIFHWFICYWIGENRWSRRRDNALCWLWWSVSTKMTTKLIFEFFCSFDLQRMHLLSVVFPIQIVQSRFVVVLASIVITIVHPGTAWSS